MGLHLVFPPPPLTAAVCACRPLSQTSLHIRRPWSCAAVKSPITRARSSSATARVAFSVAASASRHFNRHTGAHLGWVDFPSKLPSSNQTTLQSCPRARHLSSAHFRILARTQQHHHHQLQQRRCLASHSEQSRPSDKDVSSKRPTSSLPLTQSGKLLQQLTPHENIYTIPNILTFSRLAAAPLVGYFILTSQPTLALALFVYAGITDLVDGFIARRYSQQTVVGTVIDPMADKALMTICVIALAIQDGLPLWLVSLILLRDVGLAISAIYFRWISLPPPKTMARYWDFSLPSAEVRPTEISKYNTFLQLVLVGTAMVLPVLSAEMVQAWHIGAGFEIFQYVVATTTVWSGASYIYSKDAVKILTHQEIDERMAKEGKEKEKVNR